MQFLLLNTLFINKLAQTICWTLVHSLWQALFIALCAGITILATRKSTALVRYNIITVLFLALIVVSGLTFIYEWNQSGIISDNFPGNSNSLFLSILNSYEIPFYLQRGNQYLSSYADYIVMAWLIVFCFKGFQTIGAVAYTYRIKTCQIQLPPREWKEKIFAFSEQLQIKRKVKLLESGLTRMPVVIGHFKPVIFIPVGLLTQLPADQVEAVLWHELAHIRRNDYLVNLFQHIAEAVFFFNPGVLWISAVMRTERENCCDDIAIKNTNNKKQFIEALISFKEYALEGAAFAPAFPGKKNQLVQRVSRIITHQNKTLHPAEKIFFLLGLFLLVAFFSIGTHASNQKTVASVQQTPIANLAIQRNKIESLALKDPKIATAEIRKKTAATHSRATDLVMKREPIEPGFAPDLNTGQDMKERPAPLTDKERMEIDLKQRIDDQQRVKLDMQQAKKDMEQAQRDKMMAEQDARQAAIDKKFAEQNLLKIKMDRERAEQTRMPMKSKTDQQSFQPGANAKY